MKTKRRAAENQLQKPTRKLKKTKWKRLKQKKLKLLESSTSGIETVEATGAQQDAFQKETANDTADIDQTEEVSKSEDIAEKEVKDEFGSYMKVFVTEGLFNQPNAPPPPVAPPPSSSSRGIRASPAYYTIQLDDLDMTDSD